MASDLPVFASPPRAVRTMSSQQTRSTRVSLVDVSSDLDRTDPRAVDKLMKQVTQKEQQIKFLRERLSEANQLYVQHTACHYTDIAVH